MSDQCERLLDPAAAGVYRLCCPPAVLRANVELSGLCFFTLDLAKVRGKGGFLAAIAQAIHAPDWFGHNLDALEDALGDLSWVCEQSKGYVLLICNGGKFLHMNKDDHATVMQIFADTVAYWKSIGKPFWVFLD